jgi:hypothetical protein
LPRLYKYSLAARLGREERTLKPTVGQWCPSPPTLDLISSLLSNKALVLNIPSDNSASLMVPCGKSRHRRLPVMRLQFFVGASVASELNPFPLNYVESMAR